MKGSISEKVIPGVIVGLLVWWLTKSRKEMAEAKPAVGTPTYLPMSVYEAIHTTVPITSYVEKGILVFPESGGESNG